MLRHQQQEAPLAFSSGKATNAVFFETEAATRHQIPDGAGNKDLAGAGAGGYTGCNLARRPPDSAGRKLTLSGV
jgi:hypothetical protein